MNGDEIRRRRLRRGWSRDQLAHELGVPLEKVAAWEDGERIDCPRALAQVLAPAERDDPRPGSRSYEGERWSA